MAAFSSIVIGAIGLGISAASTAHQVSQAKKQEKEVKKQTKLAEDQARKAEEDAVNQRNKFEANKRRDTQKRSQLIKKAGKEGRAGTILTGDLGESSGETILGS